MVICPDGTTSRADLRVALDVATRTPLAAILRPVSTKSVDAAVLLAHGMTPLPMQPGWQRTGPLLDRSAATAPPVRVFLAMAAPFAHGDCSTGVCALAAFRSCPSTDWLSSVPIVASDAANASWPSVDP